MRASSAITAATLLLICGCATETERFQYSLAHARICPKARRLLSRPDIVEIARVVAHATRQPIAGYTIPDKFELEHKVQVITAYPGAMTQDDPSRYVFGGCTLEKVNGSWRVLECGDSLSPALAAAFLSCLDSQ